MNKAFKLIILLCALLSSQQAIKAQIGYQVSLLNTATGEPQANKTVNVNIAITNAENEIVHTEIQTATTNDFGILSLSVGNENTFKNADWNKLPFYISVTADGTFIGKSQILTIPVAEYAKTAGTVLTKEMLVGTWEFGISYTYDYGAGTQLGEFERTYTFNSDNTCIYSNHDNGHAYTIYYIYKIIGRFIYLFEKTSEAYSEYSNIKSNTDYVLSGILVYLPEENKIANNTADGAYPMLLVKQ